jgi:hypothetical protein
MGSEVNNTLRSESYTEARLREMKASGELIRRPKTYCGPLPVIKLTGKLRKGELQRIIRAAKC